MRVVLDTNVTISGLNFPGNERRVLELARRRRFELCVSEFILKETAGVLARQFGWDSTRLSLAIDTLRDAARVIEPRRQPDVVQHRHADNRVLECVVEAKAGYLVTGDRHHLLPLKEHLGAQILNAPRFLTMLEE